MEEFENNINNGKAANTPIDTTAPQTELADFGQINTDEPVGGAMPNEPQPAEVDEQHTAEPVGRACRLTVDSAD